jgi:uncharacterized protein (TIRG00374 family)
VKRRTTLSIALGILISLTALVLVIRWAGWADMLQAMKSVNWGLFGVAVLIFLLSMLARGLSWRSLLEDRYSLIRVLAVLNEGYLINNVLPWRLGEVGRAILLAGSGNDSIMRVFSSIMVERIYDIFFALIFLVLMLPEAAGLEGLTQNAAFIGVILTIAFALLFVFVQRPEWMRSIISRLPGPRARLLVLWEQVQGGLVALRDPKIFARSAGWILISWILAGVEYSLVVRAVIPEASWRWAFFMLPVTLLGGAIPSTPGFLGVYEAAGVLALSTFGVAESQALAATLLLHGMVYILGSGFGLIALASEGETISSLSRRLWAWRQSNTRMDAHEDPS